MGLFDRLRGEIVDIVEWVDDSQHTLVWRFPRYKNQIKNGAQLVVRPGQTAVFVDQGQIADVFPPGQYELSTANLPVLSSLSAWRHGFDSPFKCEVYFVSTRQLTELKWGTPNPVLLRDADFGPIRLRAFGTYALRATDPEHLLRELVGTDGVFEADEVSELLRSLIVESLSSLLGESKIAALDLASNYSHLSEQLRRRVNSRLDDEYGLEVSALFLVNVSLPPEVEQALDARSSMGVLGDLPGYSQLQMARAMTDAARNPAGGGAATGIGLGVGMAMARQAMGSPASEPPTGSSTGPMGSTLRTGAVESALAGPPPAPPSLALYHLSIAGQVHGPLGEAQVVASIAAGQANASTLVWSAGMSGWLPAVEVEALAGYFQAPPPLPPPKVGA